MYLIGNDSSAVNQSWFWPTLGISLALVISIPTVLIILIYLYLNKHKSNNESDVSSSHSTSSISEQQHRHTRHIAAFRIRSPPPPYTACEQPVNICMSPSSPPPYESHNNENPSTTVNPTDPTTTALDQSATLTSQSIQTFQA